MSTAEHNTEIVAEGLALMPGHRAGKTNFDAMIAIYLGQIQGLENVVWQLLVERWVDTAVGAQLDLLGRLVGEPRRLISAADDDYRRFIRARVAANQSDGTVNECLIILRLVFNTDVGPLILRQLFPAAMQITAVDVGVSEILSTIAASFFRAGAIGGVQIELITNVSAPDDAFTFAPAVDFHKGAKIAGSTSILLHLTHDATEEFDATNGRLMIRPGAFDQEVIHYSVFSGADVTGITNELGGAGLRFAVSDSDPVVKMRALDYVTTLRHAVTWESVVNATATGNDIEKTGGGDWTAGGASEESLAIGVDGAVEFSVDGAGDLVMVGLSIGDTDQSIADIDFAFYVQGATRVHVYESGSSVYTHNQIFLPGDIARVQRVGNEITYWFNGALIYTSLVSGAGELLVDCTIKADGDKIVDVFLDEITPLPTLTQGFAGARNLVTWENIVNCDVVRNNLEKTGGGAGWDAGASSIESIDGDGACEFTTDAAGDLVACGLGEADSDATLADIEYAMNANGAINIRIYELGVLKFTTVGAVMTPGDVGRIQRRGTEISYWFKGELIYTSITANGNTLYADCSIYGVADEIVNALLYDDESPVGGTLATSKDGG